MLRRHDNLTRMLLTIFVALITGMLLEAKGLHTWAERLEVGPVREIALLSAERWHAWVQPSGLTEAREMALEVKDSVGPWMAARENLESQDRDGSSPLVTASAPEAKAVTPPAASPLADAAASNGPASSQANAVQTGPLPAPTAENDVAEANSSPEAITDIALAGDSMMAVGLAPALSRHLTKEHRFQLIKAFRSGTGLARPEVFDWLEQYPQMLGEERPEIVICSLGANDGQNVKVDNKVLAFGSPEWDEFYRGRLVRFLDMLGSERAHILWVGMPVMKEPRFAKKMRHMNELVQSVLHGYPNVTWLDPNPSLGYVDNVFAQYSVDARGKPIKLRADDGIHMTDDGADFLFPPIRRWLEEAAADTAPPPEAQPVGALPSATVASSRLPTSAAGEAM